MNFFGHAWVAGWFSDQAPFILGSMLPDFASALRVTAPAARHATLEAGIRMHHATDRVFHQAQAFRELEQQARASLSEAGVPKGARRALAHIGVEFLIDAELALRSPAWQGYPSALRFGSSAECQAALRWSDADRSEDLALLCRRLAASTLAADTRRLAALLVARLAGRPRLELSTDAAPRVEPWLDECRPGVARLLPGLLDELMRELGAPDGATLRHAPPAPSIEHVA